MLNAPGTEIEVGPLRLQGDKTRLEIGRPQSLRGISIAAALSVAGWAFLANLHSPFSKALQYIACLMVCGLIAEIIVKKWMSAARTVIVTLDNGRVYVDAWQSRLASLGPVEVVEVRISLAFGGYRVQLANKDEKFARPFTVAKLGQERHVEELVEMLERFMRPKSKYGARRL